MKKFYLLMCALPLMGLSLVSCSEDDEIKPDNSRDDEEMYGKYEEEIPDELGQLQASLAEVDEHGNLVKRVIGVCLDPSDETEVSVGVENYEEAKKLFAGLFADTTAITPDCTVANFTCGEGSARLEKVSDDKGTIATATFDVPGLKYVSKINFIAHNAWPENASQKGFHKLGVKYQYLGWSGGPTPKATDRFDPNEYFDYVCIREYKDGVPALLVAITPKAYYLHWRYSDDYDTRMPGKGNAEMISEILRKNWNTYKGYFNTGGKTFLQDGWHYWIDKGKDYGVAVYRWAIRLDNGNVDRYDVHWDEPSHRVMFYMTAGVKG